MMKITDVSTNQNPWVMGLFIWRSRKKQGILVGKEEYFFGGWDCSLALLPLIDNIMTTWGWAAKHTDVHCSKILIGKMMTMNLDDFVRPDSASSKAMNILLGPLFDVAGYAFAAAAVLAPFSGVNIVTRFEKKTGKSFSETNMVNYLGRITFFRLELFEIMSCHRQACWIFHHWKKVLYTNDYLMMFFQCFHVFFPIDDFSVT